MLGDCAGRNSGLMKVPFTEWPYRLGILARIPEIGCVNYVHAHGRSKELDSFDPLFIMMQQGTLSCSAFFSQYREISVSGNCTTDLLILGPDRIYGSGSPFPEKFGKSRHART